MLWILTYSQEIYGPLLNKFDYYVRVTMTALTITIAYAFLEDSGGPWDLKIINQPVSR